MPSGPAGSRESSFTLYDGTRLQWNGRALLVTGNPKPRSIELRAPDGSVLIREMDDSQAIVS